MARSVRHVARGPSSRWRGRSEGRYIPRFFVRPADGTRVAPEVGSHRFPNAPTPVLGAAVAYLGLSSVAAACRPFPRAVTYGCGHITAAHPHGAPRRGLRSVRLPKV